MAHCSYLKEPLPGKIPMELATPFSSFNELGHDSTYARTTRGPRADHARTTRAPLAQHSRPTRIPSASKSGFIDAERRSARAPTARCSCPERTQTIFRARAHAAAGSESQVDGCLSQRST